MPELTWVGAGGALSILAFVIGLLLKSSSTDRRDYRDTIESYRARYVAAAEHVTRCEQAVDAERALRRQAETAAWNAVRDRDGQIEDLRQEMAALRQMVTGGSDDTRSPA